jgi:hypothetical protein
MLKKLNTKLKELKKLYKSQRRHFRISLEARNERARVKNYRSIYTIWKGFGQQKSHEKIGKEILEKGIS